MPQANIYKPDGIADHFVGQTNRETIDRLHTAYSGARAEIARGAPVVPQPGEYQWNWPDSLKATSAISADDPALIEFSSIAHEHGYSQTQIDAIPKLFDKLIEKGVIEKPFDSGKLLEELAPENYRGTSEEKQARGGERLAQAEAWIKQLDATTHGFDEGMKLELRLMTTSRDGVRVVEKLMKSFLNSSIDPVGERQAGALTKAQLDTRVADPRNQASDPKHDPAYAEQTRKLFKDLYADGDRSR